MGTLHLAVSVFSLICSLEDSVPPEVEQDYLPFLVVGLYVGTLGSQQGKFQF